MKFFFVFFLCFFSCLYAQQSNFKVIENNITYPDCDQWMIPSYAILLTPNGIFAMVDGNLVRAQQLNYIGDGIYMVSNLMSFYSEEASFAKKPSYCGRCGWMIIDGKCPNKNCGQYGPDLK